eukprot:100436_1
MARTIRKRVSKQNGVKVEYGKHKLDKWFTLYYLPRRRKDGTVSLYTAVLRLRRALVYETLRMNEQLLKKQGLKQLNWKYTSDKDEKKLISECENKLLPLMRTMVGNMLKEKGNDYDLGYSNLYLCSRIINANKCYVKANSPAYYYNDPDDEETFLMREADDEEDEEWEWI